MKWFCLILIAPSLLFSMKQLDGDFSLVPKPPPKSQILGIPFGEEPTTINDLLSGMGLKLVMQGKVDKQGRIQTFTFDGVPQGLLVAEGRTKILFFDNRLIRMNFEFTPSYSNFLLLRQQIFGSLGERFEVEKRQEMLDRRIRSILANMSTEEYEQKAELLIRRTLVQGSTYFFYALKDRQNELNVTYAFFSPVNEKGQVSPELQMHFSLREGVDAFKQYKQGKNQSKNIFEQNHSIR